MRKSKLAGILAGSPLGEAPARKVRSAQDLGFSVQGLGFAFLGVDGMRPTVGLARLGVYKALAVPLRN